MSEASEKLSLARGSNERFGNLAGLRWLDAEDIYDPNVRGEWDEALRRADAFVTKAATSPFYQEAPVRTERARIRLGRGDVEGALEDAGRALELARVVKDPQTLKREFDAIVLAGGSTLPRDLRVPGRELRGIHFAMEYLTAQNRACEGDSVDVISARDKHVIIIGGGDTGADCLGTAHRQGARSVRQLELLQRRVLRARLDVGLGRGAPDGHHPVQRILLLEITDVVA